MSKKNKPQKQIEKQVEKVVKKSHKATILLGAVFLILGIVVGIIASLYLTKNDKFELLGGKEIYLHVGEKYEEAGVAIISFGKDISDRVEISGDDLDTSLAGEYQLVYRVDDFRYKDYQLVRVIIVEEREVKANG